MLLQNKSAIITGGTRGIGLAIARTFLENGAKVAVFGSRQETAEKALETLGKEFPQGEVLALWPDLADAEAVTQAVNQVREAFGSLDILVNNAGVSSTKGVLDYAPGEFEKVMDLNVTAVYHCVRAAAAIMKEQGSGVILNTSSMVSIYGQPSGSAYPASKFALNGMTKSLARELGPMGIRVNAVAPGVTATDMVAALPQEMIAPLVARIPLRRVGEPQEVANAFLFLASDLASYITGAVLSVDGAAMT